jgi:hypothetical protein
VKLIVLKFFFNYNDNELEIRYHCIDGDEFYTVLLNNEYFDEFGDYYQDLINFKKKCILLDK